MTDEKIQIYCGTGSGRSAAALGLGMRYACAGKNVFLVRFLKGKAGNEMRFLNRLEPEIKIFTFEHFDGMYSDLTPEEQKEEKQHIRNGLNFAHKVLVTDECDVLILDEILDLAGMGIVEEDEVKHLMQRVSDDMIMIMTGTHLCKNLWPYATRVTQVITASQENPAI